MLPLTPATPRPDPYLERGERLLWIEATGEFQGGYQGAMDFEELVESVAHWGATAPDYVVAIDFAKMTIRDLTGLFRMQVDEFEAEARAEDAHQNTHRHFGGRL